MNVGPIAQLDRVPDYETGGRGVEYSSVQSEELQSCITQSPNQHDFDLHLH